MGGLQTLAAQGEDFIAPTEEVAPPVTETPVDNSPYTLKDVVIAVGVTMVSTLAIISGAAVWIVRIVMSSPLLRTWVESLAASIPPEIATKILDTGHNLQEIGVAVEDVFTPNADKVLPIPTEPII